jgi:hypothetical protein
VQALAGVVNRGGVEESGVAEQAALDTLIVDHLDAAEDGSTELGDVVAREALTALSSGDQGQPRLAEDALRLVALQTVGEEQTAVEAAVGCGREGEEGDTEAGAAVGGAGAELAAGNGRGAGHALVCALDEVALPAGSAEEGRGVDVPGAGEAIEKVVLAGVALAVGVEVVGIRGAGRAGGTILAVEAPGKGGRAGLAELAAAQGDQKVVVAEAEGAVCAVEALLTVGEQEPAGLTEVAAVQYIAVVVAEGAVAGVEAEGAMRDEGAAGLALAAAVEAVASSAQGANGQVGTADALRRAARAAVVEVEGACGALRQAEYGHLRSEHLVQSIRIQGNCVLDAQEGRGVVVVEKTADEVPAGVAGHREVGDPDEAVSVEATVGGDVEEGSDAQLRGGNQLESSANRE